MPLFLVVAGRNYALPILYIHKCVMWSLITMHTSLHFHTKKNHFNYLGLGRVPHPSSTAAAAYVYIVQIHCGNFCCNRSWAYHICVYISYMMC